MVELKNNPDNVSSSAISYNCINDDDVAVQCAETCISLETCNECQCRIIQSDLNGPWGEFMDFLFCLLPIIFLIYATMKQNPLPTTVSLPISALMLWFIRLAYLDSDPLLSCASIVSGLLEALTPLSIMAGAITLFETMEVSYCLPYMIREMKALTEGHPISELMLMFAFAQMIEGASGFGTPAIIGAPILVSTGFPALESVIVVLLMNTFTAVWSAVGTPIWFGFANLNLSDDELLSISKKSAVSLAASAFTLMPLVLNILFPFKVIKENILFIYASLMFSVGPSVAIAIFNYEFPSLIGGIVGCIGVYILVKFQVGLAEMEDIDVDELDSIQEEENKSSVKQEEGQGAAASLSSVHSSIFSSRNLLKKSDSAGSDTTDKIENVSVPFSKVGSTKNLSDVSTAFKTLSDHYPLSFSRKPGSVVSFRGIDLDPSDVISNREDDVSRSNKLEQGLMKQGNPESTKDDLMDMLNFSRPSLTRQRSNTSRVSRRSEFSRGSNWSQQSMSSLYRRRWGQSYKSTHSCLEEVISAEAKIEAHLGPRKSIADGYIREFLLRTFPIWGVLVLLMVTRIQQIGLKDLLTKQSPSFSIHFASFGVFKLSASLVIQLNNILTYPGMNWKYETLYVPFLLPFVVVSAVTMYMFRYDLGPKIGSRYIAKHVFGRLQRPAIALFGALVLVQLMVKTDTEAPAYLLGTILSDWFNKGFVVICPLLGAIGTFFSGSLTVSNLTFGGIEQIASESVGVSTTSMLALQATGGSAGVAICLNKIIAACAVVGLSNVGEGELLKKTYKIVLGSAIISAIVIIAAFVRF